MSDIKERIAELIYDQHGGVMAHALHTADVVLPAVLDDMSQRARHHIEGEADPLIRASVLQFIDDYAKSRGVK